LPPPLTSTPFPSTTLFRSGVYLGMVGDHPVEFKRFHIQDGLGIRLLRTAGLAVVWVSGRESAATALRARELAVDELIQDPSARKDRKSTRLNSSHLGISYA